MSYSTKAKLFFGFEVTEKQFDEALARSLGLVSDLVGNCHGDEPTYVIGVCAYTAHLDDRPLVKVPLLGAPKAKELKQYAAEKGVEARAEWLLTVERF